MFNGKTMRILLATALSFSASTLMEANQSEPSHARERNPALNQSEVNTVISEVVSDLVSDVSAEVNSHMTSNETPATPQS